MTLIEANRLVAFGLVVLIWLVQLIVYPAFAEIVPDRFKAWHGGYTRAITWVVAPLMLGQVALMTWLLATHPSWPLASAACLAALAWAGTFLHAVPAHEKLRAGGHDPEVIGGLVATNWLRTVAWTAAFLCLLAVK